MNNNIHINDDKVYILDFDGVICDSIDECMLNSYNTFNNTNVVNINDLPKKYVSYFYKYRYHVRPAKEYFILCKTYDYEVDLSLHKFDKYRKKFENYMADYESKFFQKRCELKKNIILWLSYHKIYEQAKKFFNNITNNIFILTTKDYDSVKKLVKHFGYFSKVEDIISKEISNDKEILFEYLFSRHKSLLNDKRVIFIDDNEYHLKSVKKFPVELYFARWGYSKKQISNNFRGINSFEELI